MCEFCVMWFWRMVVAVLDTERENNGPLQSPQLGRAHQGWIWGTPQVGLVALLPVHANYPCILRPPPSEPTKLNSSHPQPIVPPPMPSHKTSHPQNRLDRCHRVCPRKPRDNSCSTQPCNSHLTRFWSQMYFTIALWFFNLCWWNKYELHVWTMDVYSSRSDRYDATSR